MKKKFFEFTLFTNKSLGDDESIDKIFELGFDFLPGVWCGHPYLDCTVLSDSLDNAINSTVDELTDKFEGLIVIGVGDSNGDWNQYFVH